MADVYNIQTVMTLGGNLAPELAAILRNMKAIDKEAKSVEKALGRWVSPIDRTVAGMGRVAREMASARRGAQSVEREIVRTGKAMTGLKAGGGMDKEMARWAAAMARPLAEMRTMRTTTQGVATAARGVSRSIDSWAGRISSAAAAMRRMNAAASGTHFPNPPHVNGGGAGGYAGRGGHRGRGRGGRGGHGHAFGQHEGSHLAGAMGVYGGLNTVEYFVEQAAGPQREDIRAKNAGLSPEENTSLRARSAELSRQYPSLNPLGIREQGRLLIPNVGDYDTAMKVLPEYLKGQVALQTIGGPEEGGKDMEAFARYIDIIGRSMSVEDTNKLIDGYVRSRQLDPEAVRSNDYVQAAKSAASPGKALNVEFWSKIAPALFSQQGGARSGTDIASAYQNTVVGRGTKESLMAQNEAGLREGFTTKTGKGGKVTVTNKGSLTEEGLYNSNPYEWAKKILTPLMVKKGMLPEGYAKGDYKQDLSDNQRAESTKFLSQLFSSRRGANIFSMMIQDMEQIEKFTQRWGKTRGTGDVLKDQANDPFVAWQATKTQTATASANLAAPAIPGIIENLNRVNAALGGVADTLEKHPVAAQSVFGTGAAVVGGAAAAGVTALTLAAVGTLSLPALAVGSIAAVTIGALTLPWGSFGDMLGIRDAWNNNGRIGRSGRPEDAGKGGAGKPFVPDMGAYGFTRGLPTAPPAETKTMPALPAPVARGWGDWLKDKWGSGGNFRRGPQAQPSVWSEAAMGTPGTVPGGAPAAIKQAGDAIGAAGTAASSAAPGLTSTASGIEAVKSAANVDPAGLGSTASGITSVKSAADGAGGSLAALAARISGLGSISLPGAAAGGGAKTGAAGGSGPAPAGGGAGAAPAAPAAPGKQSGVIYRGGGGAPIHVATSVMLDGRKVAQSVTRHQVASNDTRNGTGSFDSNRLKTPVGYSGTTQA